MELAYMIIGIPSLSERNKGRVVAQVLNRDGSLLDEIFEVRE